MPKLSSFFVIVACSFSLTIYTRLFPLLSTPNCVLECLEFHLQQSKHVQYLIKMSDIQDKPPQSYQSDKVDDGLATQRTRASVGVGDIQDSGDATARAQSSQLQRHLGYRQIQLIALGGSIGTANFISIGSGLIKSGPGSLFIAYTLYAAILSLVNNCAAEMTVFMPVPAAFIRHAGRWVDESLGFMVGWNFFIYEAILIPFEISAVTLVLSYWRDDIPSEAVVGVCIFLYVLINVTAVKNFGEAEFWLASGKILLLAIIYSFTFITMVGGNPKHDAYGFRYWKNPGSFAEYITTGTLGQFEGFLAALWSASFTIVGPEYVAMVAGEAQLPRRYMKDAFKATYARLFLIFAVTALAVGIVCPYDNETLVGILTGTKSGGGSAAASPYVIAMNLLGINVLPHVVNALLVTSIFSAGNAYTYYGSRSLYGLALEGHAPKFLRKCSKSGVPYMSLAVTCIFPCLAFLNASTSTSKVLTWFTNIITAAGVINFVVICITYIFFYRACQAQGLDRKTLPYCGYFQPYSAYIGCGFMVFVLFVYGYSVFIPGHWSVSDFFTYYTMTLVCPVLFVGWKYIKGTSFVKPGEADLVWDAPAIDDYEANFEEVSLGFWRDIAAMFGIVSKKKIATEA